MDVNEKRRNMGIDGTGNVLYKNQTRNRHFVSPIEGNTAFSINITENCFT